MSTIEPMKDMTPGCQECLDCASLCYTCFDLLRAFGTTDVDLILLSGRRATSASEETLESIRQSIETLNKP